ncbi:MAG: hypothetical protein ACXWP5_07210 [Bdellovibrionota bacterium]
MKHPIAFATGALLLIAATALAANVAPKKPAAAPSHAPEQAAPSRADQVIWDNWYTVTVNKVIHYEYYNEHAEIKKGRYFFQNHAWKMEEDFLNEEQLGEFAEVSTELTPMFFNFHSTYRTTETTIDGTVDPKRMMTVKVHKGNTDLPIVHASLPQKTIFSSFFPIWIGQRLAAMKPESNYYVQVVLEDNIESGFGAQNGQLRMEKPDTFATTSKTTKLSISLNDMKSTWYVDKTGAPVRIEVPAQNTLVQRVSEKEAKGFLE